jgi:hypothetical protein
MAFEFIVFMHNLTGDLWLVEVSRGFCILTNGENDFMYPSLGYFLECNSKEFGLIGIL